METLRSALSPVWNMIWLHILTIYRWTDHGWPSLYLLAIHLQKRSNHEWKKELKHTRINYLQLVRDHRLCLQIIYEWLFAVSLLSSSFSHLCTGAITTCDIFLRLLRDPLQMIKSFILLQYYDHTKARKWQWSSCRCLWDL